MGSVTFERGDVKQNRAERHKFYASTCKCEVGVVHFLIERLTVKEIL